MTADTAFLDEVLVRVIALKRDADGALAQATDAQFFTIPADGSNSLAVLVKHLGGNLRSRWTNFLTDDGEKPGRDRDSEFEILESDTRLSLSLKWEEGWNQMMNAIRSLTPADLSGGGDDPRRKTHRYWRNHSSA